MRLREAVARRSLEFWRSVGVIPVASTASLCQLKTLSMSPANPSFDVAELVLSLRSPIVGVDGIGFARPLKQERKDIGLIRF